MKQPKLTFVLALTTWLATGSMTSAQEHPGGEEFSYNDQAGWRGQCQTGQSQSPVSLGLWALFVAPDQDIDEQATPFLDRSARSTFSYGPYPLSSRHTGHSIQLDAPPDTPYGFQFSAEPRPGWNPSSEPFYKLLQVHFHVPAEHSFRTSWRSEDGVVERYALEAHFVHMEAGGTKAVLAILFKEGAPNDFLTALLAQPLPESGARTPRTDAGDLMQLLPAGAEIYRYYGSLTTPGCDEGVIWHVAKAEMTASPEQISGLRDAVGFDNNRRPVNRIAKGVNAPVVIRR